MLFFTSDGVMMYGARRVFAPLIEQSNMLFTKGVPVGFVTILLIGDNLGLNFMMDIGEGFSANANFFCRFSAIKHELVWNDLIHFRLVNIRSAQGVNDFLEGILKIGLLQVLTFVNILQSTYF